jgi:monoamine oxidase
MAMGIVNKVCLVFPRIFWPLNIQKLGSLGDSSMNEKLSYADYEKKRGRFFLFRNSYSTTQLPCLTVYISGPAAPDIEGETDDIIVGEILDRLSVMFPEESPLPKPIETIVTRWSTDAHSKGCSSILRTGGKVEDMTEIVADAKRLYFAGEHVAMQVPGNLEGMP